MIGRAIEICTASYSEARERTVGQKLTRAMIDSGVHRTLAALEREGFDVKDKDIQDGSFLILLAEWPEAVAAMEDPAFEDEPLGEPS